MDREARRPLRILLTEGASTSARQAVTALGLRGHHVEVCDPNPYCLSRYSSLIRRFHRCPGIGADPEGYLRFVMDLLEATPFDVLLPIHEQGLLFAKVRHLLPPNLGLALPTFEAYSLALDKRHFSCLLSELGIAQPETRIASDPGAIGTEIRLPFVVKSAIGTASRATWIVRNDADLVRLRPSWRDVPGAFLVQAYLEGPLEHAQAVFDHSRLVAMHGYRQIVAGAGGGESHKESVQRPDVRVALETIAARLSWHGALSVDYILHEGVPHFIDCNPRLVEPMSAFFAGTDLADLLVRISIGENPQDAEPGQSGVRTHIGLQALFGIAMRTGSRRAVVRECWTMLRARGIYSRSREELTPFRLDRMSALPLVATAMALLLSPRAAHTLPKRGWGAGLLTPESIRIIEERIG